MPAEKQKKLREELFSGLTDQSDRGRLHSKTHSPSHFSQSECKKKTTKKGTKSAPITSQMQMSEVKTTMETWK